MCVAGDEVIGLHRSRSRIISSAMRHTGVSNRQGRQLLEGLSYVREVAYLLLLPILCRTSHANSVMHHRGFLRFASLGGMRMPSLEFTKKVMRGASVDVCLSGSFFVLVFLWVN